VSERTRDERAGIDFPDATWTSFDRYDRYGAIARCLRATLGEGEHRVLDVGDAAGYLRLFAGDLRLSGVDLSVQPDRLPGAVALVGDGTRLPFADRSFDAVVSSDVLEHVVPAGRGAFIDELCRVSDDLVVLAAPFDTDGVAGVEELIRRFVLLATGKPQEQLEEHRERCLPSLDDATAHLARHGRVVMAGNGNLWDWLELMLVKHQLLARPALLPLHDGIDALYNLSFGGRASQAPYYRHLIAARREGSASLGTSKAAGVPDTTMAGVLSALLSAASPESTRQDVRPAVDEVLMELRSLRADLTGWVEAIGERLDVFEQVQEEIVGPVRRARSAMHRVRRRRGAPAPDERT
jgi:Methyltransferase domain